MPKHNLVVTAVIFQYVVMANKTVLWLIPRTANYLTILLYFEVLKFWQFRYGIDLDAEYLIVVIPERVTDTMQVAIFKQDKFFFDSLNATIVIEIELSQGQYDRYHHAKQQNSDNKLSGNAVTVFYQENIRIKFG